MDTIGLLLTVLISAASAQDRDAAKPLLRDLRRAFPPVTLTWAGGGSAHPYGPGPRSRSPSRSSGGPVTCIPSRCCPAAGVAGRILAWITWHRRTVRDYQRLASHHETCLCRAMMIVMTRRLARTPGRAGTAAGPQVTGKPVREAT